MYIDKKKMRFCDFVVFSFLLYFSLRGSAKIRGKEEGSLGDIISSSTFEEMLPNRNDNACPARGFYTYEAFITAAEEFPEFGNTGNLTTRKREIAAFFGQTSHETTGGWATAPGGPFAWGYCFIREIAGGTYCQDSPEYPCCPDKQYYGRGPIQITWNYNYGLCSKDLWNDVNYLLCNPDVVETDPIISFKTAIWFWMTPQNNKPSCHDVITDNWTPTSVDVAANRLPGYGVITNIINGGIECGTGQNAAGEDRIGFYKRYCDMLGIDYGDNLDCYNQRPFGYGLLKMVGTMSFGAS